MARVSVVTIAEAPDPAALASIATQTIEIADHHIVTVDDGLPRLDEAFVALHDGRAVLQPDAIEVLVGALVADPSADVAYGDHEVGAERIRWYAPGHSPERLRHQAFWGPLVVTRAEQYRRITAAGALVSGAALYDVSLRLTEATDRVTRVPQVTGHVSAVDDVDGLVAAVERHCARASIEADVRPGSAPGTVEVVRRLVRRPTVSVVIPTRGSSGPVFGNERCFVVEAVRSLVERSTYEIVEYVIVHDAATPPEVLVELSAVAGERLRLVPFDDDFNFSAKIDLGVSRASGDLMLLLNDDTELIDAASVERLVAVLSDPGVGMVGAKLLFEDGRLQHGGHVYNGSIHHACFGRPGDSPGPAPSYPLAVARECSGVTAGCAMVRRSVFDEVGGFERRLPHNYNDVDFSLKVRSAGHRIIWTPQATWFHFESRTRDPSVHPDEVALVDERWHDELRDDPYYHPDLPVDRADWEPAPKVRDQPPPTLVARVRRVIGSVIPRRRLRRPHGVNLVGYLGATSGLGDRARELEAVLREAGIRCSTWDLDLTESSRAETATSAGADAGVIFDTTVAVVTALAFPGLDGVYPPLVRDVDRVVGYWFWELADVPDSHRPALDMVDEIWAPTTFVRDAYASATDLPVELVPLPIPPPTPSERDRRSFGWGDEFVFLCSFDHLSSMERKHPLGVVEAFRRAFPDDAVPVRLSIKSINAHLRPHATSELAAAAGDPRIEIRDGYLPAADQAALVAAADCFVSLHRSEGLGLHIAEAMWLGTPVIATDYSGSTDLTAPDGGDVAELVPAELVPVVGGGEAYQHGEWADPDLDIAAAAMRRLATDQRRRSEITILARARIERLGDRADAARRVAALLSDDRHHRRPRVRQ
jgi:GT2 family glycosyltransferase